MHPWLQKSIIVVSLIKSSLTLSLPFRFLPPRPPNHSILRGHCSWGSQRHHALPKGLGNGPKQSLGACPADRGIGEQAARALPGTFISICIHNLWYCLGTTFQQSWIIIPQNHFIYPRNLASPALKVTDIMDWHAGQLAVETGQEGNLF